LAPQVDVHRMSLFSVGIEFGGKRKVRHVSLPRANVLQTSKNLAVRSGLLVELIRWKTKNLEPAASVLRLKIVQAPKVVCVPSVGRGVDDEKNLSAMVVHWRRVSLQIFDAVVEDGGGVEVIRVTIDLFVAFVNSFGERQRGGEKEEGEEKVLTQSASGKNVTGRPLETGEVGAGARVRVIDVIDG